MKKKIFMFIISLFMLMSLEAYVAEIGDKIGTVYNTDIVAYINNYAVPSYAANGQSVIVVEDLRNFGFDVVWDEGSRTLSVFRNEELYPAAMNVRKKGITGSYFCDLLHTDISVYANGVKIPSYAINGYTVIPIESLTVFGICNWVPEQRAVKLWVDGLNIRYDMQEVQWGYTLDEAYQIAVDYCNIHMPVSNEDIEAVIEMGGDYKLKLDLSDAGLLDENEYTYLIGVGYFFHMEMIGVNKLTGETKYHGGGQDYAPGWIDF